MGTPVDPLADLPFPAVMLLGLDTIPFNVRVANGIANKFEDPKMARLSDKYLGDLVSFTEAEMLRTPNFGRKSLNEIKDVFAQISLHTGVDIHFGMAVPDEWPPENVHELAELYARTLGRELPPINVVPETRGPRRTREAGATAVAEGTGEEIRPAFRAAAESLLKSYIGVKTGENLADAIKYKLLSQVVGLNPGQERLPLSEKMAADVGLSFARADAVVTKTINDLMEAAGVQIAARVVRALQFFEEQLESGLIERSLDGGTSDEKDASIGQGLDRTGEAIRRARERILDNMGLILQGQPPQPAA